MEIRALFRWRRVWRGAAALALMYLVPCTAGWMTPAAPTDLLLNIVPAARHAEYQVAAPSRVVILHGILRSNWSMHRLARALQSHGHDVLNYGYPSTAQDLDGHARDLAAAIRSRWGELALREGIHIVGHSMGGMVAEAWMRRRDAVPVRSAVFLGVPHRGARLADLRKHWWLFQLVMGTRAGLQLSPGAPIHRRPNRLPDSVGFIAGGLGDGEGWHGSIPGDDDGTVAVVEALDPRRPHLRPREDAADPLALEFAMDRSWPSGWHRLVLPVGHTHMTFADPVLRAVLCFLKFGRFPAPG